MSTPSSDSNKSRSVYDRLEAAVYRYADAKVGLIDAKTRLEEIKGDAFLHGRVQGTNEKTREAYFREANPSEYSDLLLAEREVEFAHAELEVAKLRVEEFLLHAVPSQVHIRKEG